jgi:hypothetical protein
MIIIVGATIGDGVDEGFGFLDWVVIVIGGAALLQALFFLATDRLPRT